MGNAQDLVVHYKPSLETNWTHKFGIMHLQKDLI
jgi:hypothetical protein